MLDRYDNYAKNRYNEIRKSEKVIRELCKDLGSDHARVVLSKKQPRICADDTQMDQQLPNFAAVSVVEGFCQSLPFDEFVGVRPVYIFHEVLGGYFAQCVLPTASEVAPIQGSVQSRKFCHSSNVPN